MDLKSIEAAKRLVGGSFRLSVLLQKRIIELVRGAPPVIENPEKERGPIEVALREILEGKISLEMIPSEDFEKLVEQARLEKEARAGHEQDAGAAGLGAPIKLPSPLDLGPDPVKV
jgi:DNA-directed RNA polymerase subunit omega